ncbi:SDR family NAD(P)-dependent oxidoreductase [Nocardia uniformis]|uniref:SDR family NAD(P)-dependent oxidoreductase n=1 Tax=Nocardia uniformis TaxID=53432 RepID=A0A849C7V3_9NOCA|nr:SDR family NAD(P)-dependent oxidoreductase [Nocardia uniformis]NNH70959.1 SDR family NAD(P)-dependent oxidoreductase [Nocardia uniformis]
MALPRPSADTAVVVTGAASGIGREVARELSLRGYNLVLADIQDAVGETADQLRGHRVEVEVHQLDLTEPEARGKFIEAVQSGPRAIVGVANVAGLISIGRFDKLALGRERILVDVSVSALHHLTGAFLPAMQARGEGAILNVASPAGVAPLPYLASYSAAKAFVIYFSTALHAELKGSGVSCTTFLPGITKTPLAYGIEETKFLPDWAWSLPGFHEPSNTARRAVRSMLRGKKLGTAGPDAWLVSLAPRYVPPGLLQPVVRVAGKYAFPGEYETSGQRVRAGLEKALGRIGGAGHADKPKSW